MYRNQFPRHLVALNIGAIPYLLGRTMSVTVQVRQDELGRKNAGQCKIQIGHRRCDPFFDHVRFGRSCGNKVLYYCRYISRRLGFLRVEFSLQEPGRLRRGRRIIRLDIHSRSCRDGHLDLGARRHRSGSRFVSRRHDEWGRNDRLARRHGARVPFRLRWRSEQRAGPEPLDVRDRWGPVRPDIHGRRHRKRGRRQRLLSQHHHRWRLVEPSVTHACFVFSRLYS
jgi:hypothetical protein